MRERRRARKPNFLLRFLCVMLYVSRGPKTGAVVLNAAWAGVLCSAITVRASDCASVGRAADGAVRGCAGRVLPGWMTRREKDVRREYCLKMSVLELVGLVCVGDLRTGGMRAFGRWMLLGAARAVCMFDRSFCRN